MSQHANVVKSSKPVPKPIKALARSLGLRKPLRLLTSSEFREINRRIKELKGDFHRRGFESVYQRHINGSDGYKKYLNLDETLETALKMCFRLEVLDAPPMRIMDIGCGTGYFLYTSRFYRQHDILGIDIEDTAIFNDMVRLLDIPRLVWRVKAMEPLPDLGKPFDLITAMAIVFDLHRTENIWGPEQWKFLLEDCRSRLTPNGRVFLHFNPATTRDFDFVPDDVAEMLRRLPGGELSSTKEFFTLAAR